MRHGRYPVGPGVVAALGTVVLGLVPTGLATAQPTLSPPKPASSPPRVELPPGRHKLTGLDGSGGQVHEWDAERELLLDFIHLGRKSPAEQAVLVAEQAELVYALRVYSQGNDLCRRGRYAEAEPLLRTALEINRRMRGEDYIGTVACYNNLAIILDEQGKYLEAEPLLRTALASRRRVRSEGHSETAKAYNNLAGNLWRQGRYAAAEPLLRTTLEIRRRMRGEDHPETATSYNNLALNLGEQGRSTAAEPLLRTALEIARRVQGEDHPNTATCYNNLAENLRVQGKSAAAEPLYRTALETRRRVLGEDHPDTATSYNNLALNLGEQGRYAEAEPLLRTALEIARRVLGEDHPNTATCYNNLALNLGEQGKYAAAEPLLRTALEIVRRVLGEDHPRTAICYNNVAFDLDAQGRYAEAEALLILAARSFEHARIAISSTGLDRATFAAEHSPLTLLAALQARRGLATEAWAHLEAHLARGLLDDLSARQGRPLDDQERRHEQDLLGQLQRLDKQLVALAPRPQHEDAARRPLHDRLRRDRDAVLAELTAFERDLTDKYGPAAGQTYDLATIQAHLPPDAALVAWLDLKPQPRAADSGGTHWACLVRSRGQPAWVTLTGSGPDRAWTDTDDQLPARVRATLIAPPADPAAPWRDLTARLAAQRLGPLRPGLRGEDGRTLVRHLIVLIGDN